MSNPIDLCQLSDVRAELQLAPNSIGSVLITDQGSGYTSITITAVPADGNGTMPTFSGILSGGKLIGISILTPGKGITQAPTLNITGDGTGAAAIVFMPEDTRLNRIITAASQFMLTQTKLPQFATQTLTEKRNGNGQAEMVLRNTPIISVASVEVNGVVIPPSLDSLAPGWVNDSLSVMLIGGGFFGRQAYIPYDFCLGFQNVVFEYTWGFTSIPTDIVDATIVLSCQKYRRAQHRDQDSQRTADGQVVTFAKGDIPSEVKTVINSYRSKGIIE